MRTKTSRGSRVTGCIITGLLGGGMLALSPASAASNAQYTLTPIATLGAPAPGGGEFDLDFEPAAINNAGSAFFVADVTLGGEGAFVLRQGKLSRLAFDELAPGGGSFGATALGGSINENGYVAFAFSLDPFTFPLGSNVGLYVAAPDNSLRAMVVPGTTLTPGGAVFDGVSFAPQINEQRQVAFTGLIRGADRSPGPPGVDGSGLGLGVFVIDSKGKLTTVAQPGDPAPGGGVFDLAGTGGINNRGDVVFGGHVEGDDCAQLAPQFFRIACLAGTYVKSAPTGELRTIVRQGGALPGGATCHASRGRLINDAGDVTFGCQVEPLQNGERVGLFIHSKGVIAPIALPGDPMPGGGTLQVAGAADSFHLSQSRQVVFTGQLQDGSQGIYAWSQGTLNVIARSGTVIPDIGTIVAFVPPDAVGQGELPFGIGANERGDVLFTATVDDGVTLRGMLFIASRH